MPVAQQRPEGWCCTTLLWGPTMVLRLHAAAGAAV